MQGDANSETARGRAKQSLVIIVPRAKLDLCRSLSHAFGDEAHVRVIPDRRFKDRRARGVGRVRRSEEHTSELQSPCNLVCRLLLEKKKKNNERQIKLRL